MTDEQKQATAWHEAAHALVNVLCEHTPPLHKVTIIPRGQALGATMWNRGKKEMLDQITVLTAGRIGEEIVAGDISTGAAGDIQQATQLARAMVCTFGMSEKLGMVQYGEDSDYVFLGRDIVRSKDYSEQTAREIDAEVKRIIDECYRRARDMINAHRRELELIAAALLEQETLDGELVEAIVRTGRIPPRPEKPSDEEARPEEAPEGKLGEAVPPKLPPGFTSPAPSPA